MSGAVPSQNDALERAILELLAERRAGATICPSEAARAVGGDEDDGWRDLMEPARDAARRLVAEGLVEITQGGEVVDPATLRGPIRIRRRCIGEEAAVAFESLTPGVKRTPDGGSE